MNKLIRWYLLLTEKQAKTIILISAIISYILFAVLAVSSAIFVETSNFDMPLIIILFVASVGMIFCFYTLTYSLLWYTSYKREYLYKKKHNEIILRVKGRFNLGPEFKEVLYVPSETDYDFINFFKVLNELEVKYFAEEINGVILVSVRSKDGKELELQRVNSYYFFDLNLKPKE